MAATQIWILSGVLGIVLVVLGFLSKNWFNNIASKLESIVAVLNDIKISLTSHAKDIEYIKAEHTKIHERLNSHSERIHELEKINHGK